MKKKMPAWKKRLYRDGIVIGLLVMTAIGLVGEIARQDWHTKVTAYPTKTETAIALKAQQLLDEMTLEEKVGQMFLVSCPEEERLELIAQYHPGGFVLDTGDFKNKTKNTVAEMIYDYQTASVSIPLLIAVNEEGGEVNTISLSHAFRGSAFLSARELFTTGGLSLAESDTIEKCQLLSGLGINMNFAPVADVTTAPNGFMYDRSLGANGEDTGRYVETVVSVMNEQGIVSVLKHFPGYGNIRSDANAAPAVDDRTLQELEYSDYIPFREGIGADAPVIMMGHSIVSALDPDRPASLSDQVHRELRRQMGFEGVIVSDGLMTESVLQYAGEEQIAVEAIKAGSDLLCTDDCQTQITAVLKAVRSGGLSEARIDESVLRILKLKIQFNLI